MTMVILTHFDRSQGKAGSMQISCMTIQIRALLNKIGTHSLKIIYYIHIIQITSFFNP